MSKEKIIITKYNKLLRRNIKFIKFIKFIKLFKLKKNKIEQNNK